MEGKISTRSLLRAGHRWWWRRRNKKKWVREKLLVDKQDHISGFMRGEEEKEKEGGGGSWANLRTVSAATKRNEATMTKRLRSRNLPRPSQWLFGVGGNWFIWETPSVRHEKKEEKQEYCVQGDAMINNENGRRDFFYLFSLSFIIVIILMLIDCHAHTNLCKLCFPCFPLPYWWFFFFL